jgi:hypothetical protein
MAPEMGFSMAVDAHLPLLTLTLPLGTQGIYVHVLILGAAQHHQESIPAP